MQPQSRKSQFALHIKPNPEGSDSGVKWGKRAISKVERPQHLKASKIVIYVLLFVVVLFIALALDLLYSLTNSVSLFLRLSCSFENEQFGPRAEALRLHPVPLPANFDSTATPAAIPSPH